MFGLADRDNGTTRWQAEGAGSAEIARARRRAGERVPPRPRSRAQEPERRAGGRRHATRRSSRALRVRPRHQPRALRARSEGHRLRSCAESGPVHGAVGEFAVDVACPCAGGGQHRRLGDHAGAADARGARTRARARDVRVVREPDGARYAEHDEPHRRIRTRVRPLRRAMLRAGRGVYQRELRRIPVRRA